jgi:protein gp37
MCVEGYENGFRLTLLPERLEDPIRRKKATVYFVNSMSDLFHEQIPDSYLRQVLAVIRQTPQHTFQILTKRAERMAGFQGGRLPMPGWGAVENRAQACLVSLSAQVSSPVALSR